MGRCRGVPLRALLTVTAIVVVVVCVLVVVAVSLKPPTTTPTLTMRTLATSSLEVSSLRTLFLDADTGSADTASTKITNPNGTHHAYNPSCLRLSTGVLVRSYKVSLYNRCPNSTSDLDYHLHPRTLQAETVLSYELQGSGIGSGIGSGREVLLDIPAYPSQGPFPATCDGRRLLSYIPGYEDLRLVECSGHLLAVANARTEAALGASRMYLIYVCPVRDVPSLPDVHTCGVTALKSPYLPEIPQESQDEKNWSPLVYSTALDTIPYVSNAAHDATSLEELYLVYSVAPTIVLGVPNQSLARILAGETVEEVECSKLVSRVSTVVADTPVRLPNGDEKTLRQLRGGTQLLRTREGYLGLGHYRSGLDYYTVPYLLSISRPFQCLEVGTPAKLDGSQVEYAAGIRRERDGRLYVTYGVDDCVSREAEVLITSSLPRTG
jgi:hypothetical protein